MHASRTTNASLFVTVLSACLGLVATGVPAAYAHAPHEGALAAVNRSQALIAGVTAAGQLSPQRTLKLAATSNSFFHLDICQSQLEPEENLYQNSRALIDKHPHLVVTRLPRAGLI
ncbi:MAG TPA: hypothetical protein VM911_13700 [Pyrinomonadaceae bacterium]|nr:hypothetical protein [Pyrinomonadaceae bacterium]